MNEVRTSIEIAASPSDVWRVVMDPERLKDWVTIHRSLHSFDPWPPRKGAKMDQTLAVRGAPFRVRWTLAEVGFVTRPRTNMLHEVLERRPVPMRGPMVADEVIRLTGLQAAVPSLCGR